MPNYEIKQKTDANNTLQDIVISSNNIEKDTSVTQNSTKPVTSGAVFTALSSYVPTTRTINSKALSSNITLEASDVNALPSYSKSISTSAGNPREVKFVRVDYSAFDGNNAAYFRIGAMCSHGNGSSYTFLEDIIIGVNMNGAATCSVYKQVQNTSTYTVDSHTVYFGDVYWVVNTTDKYVDFYIICGQYATINFTPFMKIGNTISDTSKIVQYTGSATLYSSGTRVWDTLGNGSLYAKTSDLAGKQDTLVSGTNIKTINNESILGSGNITISGGDMTNVAKTNVDNNFSTGQTISGNCKASAFTSDSSGFVIKVSDGNEISFGMNAGNAIYLGYDNRTGSTAVPSVYNFGNGTGSTGATSGTIQCGSVVENGTALSSKYEAKSNKVTSLSSSSTDTEYPSAKCVYDMIGDVESLLTAINSGNGV